MLVQSAGSARPVARTNAAYSRRVIGVRLTANAATRTSWVGPSSGKRPTSSSGAPITNVPAGTATIAGQSRQSLSAPLERRGALAHAATAANVIANEMIRIRIARRNVMQG